MNKPVSHFQVYRKNAFGGTTNTTLCGRMSNAGDDMNVADGEQEVTCKLCLRRMKYRPKAA